MSVQPQAFQLFLRRLLAVGLLVIMVMMGVASSASAAHRRVPFGFFGVDVNPGVAAASSIDAQAGVMAKSGVESVRTNFYWDTAEPAPGVYNWSGIDQFVTAAASHGLQVIPVVEFTPRWASSKPHGDYADSAPANPSTYAAFLTALIQRYGPHGSFWTQHPQIPRVPIRDWQIWDEPAGTAYDWKSPPWPATYTRMLKAAYKAVHRADPGAKVVSGAMVGLNTTNATPWAETSDLYRAGAKGYFDILAVNAFTNAPKVSDSVNRSLEIVSLVRQVMRRNRDGSKPIWVTEVTWTAAAGRIPPSEYAGFETTAKGQAQRLAAYYAKIATSRTAGIGRAFWFQWASSYSKYVSNTPTFEFTGLLKWQPGASAFQPLPLLSTYAGVAAKYEGCHKTTNAQKCG